MESVDIHDSVSFDRVRFHCDFSMPLTGNSISSWNRTQSILTRDGRSDK